MIKKLFCFIGTTGCGKSTLLENLGVRYLDVLKHIQKYKDESGAVVNKEVSSLKAYNDFFIEIENTKDDVCYAEFGTNYPQLVVEKLGALSAYVVIFLCVLDAATCLERHKKRGRKIKTEQLMEKMKRNFPGEHIALIEKPKLTYFVIDMKPNVEIIVKNVLEIIENTK